MEKRQTPNARDRSQPPSRQTAEPPRKPATKPPPRSTRPEKTYLEERRPEHYAG